MALAGANLSSYCCFTTAAVSVTVLILTDIFYWNLVKFKCHLNVAFLSTVQANLMSQALVLVTTITVLCNINRAEPQTHANDSLYTLSCHASNLSH